MSHFLARLRCEWRCIVLRKSTRRWLTVLPLLSAAVVLVQQMRGAKLTFVGQFGDVTSGIGLPVIVFSIGIAAVNIGNEMQTGSLAARLSIDPSRHMWLWARLVATAGVAARLIVVVLMTLGLTMFAIDLIEGRGSQISMDLLRSHGTNLARVVVAGSVGSIVGLIATLWMRSAAATVGLFFIMFLIGDGLIAEYFIRSDIFMLSGTLAGFANGRPEYFAVQRSAVAAASWSMASTALLVVVTQLLIGRREIR